MRSTLYFECPALQDLHDNDKNLFKAPHGDAMILFMWQDDIIGVARFIDVCLETVYTSAGPPAEDKASDQPYVGWKRCNDSSSSSCRTTACETLPWLQRAPLMSYFKCRAMMSASPIL